MCISKVAADCRNRVSGKLNHYSCAADKTCAVYRIVISCSTVSCIPGCRSICFSELNFIVCKSLYFCTARSIEISRACKWRSSYNPAKKRRIICCCISGRIDFVCCYIQMNLYTCNRTRGCNCMEHTC